MNSLQARTPNEIAFLADTNTHAFRFDIPSSDGTKSYRVSTRKATGKWECSCPAWIYQKAPLADRKPCKHLQAMSDLLLQIEGKAAAPVAVAAAPSPKAAPAPKRIAANGADAARQAIEALVAQAEAEAANARAELDRAEAKLAALRLAAKAAA